MLNLKSVIDGFKVVIGNWMVHIAALLTMIIFVRPEEYNDDHGRSDRAMGIYIALIIMHIVLALVKFIKMFVTDEISIITPVFMLLVVIMTIYMCEDWFFRHK